MTTTMNTSPEETAAAAKAWLGRVGLGKAVHHQDLTVFPLLPSSPPGGDRYTLLADAIERGEAKVEEVGEGARVAFLTVTNGSTKPILIPEGEILIGAKQNRAVNLTVLVAAGVTRRLPVSCVERGRWRTVSRHFTPDAYAHPTLREKKMRSAMRNRKAMGEATSNQGEVWSEVDEHLQALDAHSPSDDATAAYAAADERLEDYRKAIRLPSGAAGFIAVLRGSVVGLDLFDSPATLERLWERLADAYFLQALRGGGEPLAPMPALAKQFFEAVVESLEPAERQPELGFDLEIDSDEVSGTGLWHDGAVCHLAAFPVDKPAAGGDGYGEDLWMAG